MRSPLYLPRKEPSPTSYDYSTHPEILNLDLPSLHNQSLHFSPSQYDFPTEIGVHGNIFNDSTATDMADKHISQMTYDELESQAFSSPGQFMQTSSPGELDPSTIFLEDPTSKPDGLFLEASLSMMQSFPDNLPLTQEEISINILEETQAMSTLDEMPICWDHGCNGKVFSSWSNLRRHQRERASQAPKCFCPRCGAHFSRTTARNQHLANMSCKRIRRYSNGRMRPSTQKNQETYGTQL